MAPYRAFTSAGHEVVVATPGGVLPTADQASLAPEVNGGQDAIAAELASVAGLGNPIKLEDADLADYASVFYPGGHGPMEDLAVNANSAWLLVSTLAAGKPGWVAAFGTGDSPDRGLSVQCGARPAQRRWSSSACSARATCSG